MAPVMSSVTVASCVRSPSATVCSSFISRKMAAWLASLTRLASCSCALGLEPVRSATGWRLRPVAQLHVSRSRRHSARAASDSTNSISDRAGAQAGVRRQLVLQVSERACAAVRCRPGSRPALRARRPGPAGCPGWRRPACGSVRTVFSSASSCSRVCGSRCRAGAARGLPSSRPWAISWKEFRSLPSRNTASGLTPSTVRNSLADLPMRCVSITSWPAAEISGTVRVLLQLERRHGLGHFEQVGRLAVDVAQRGADLRQDLLLRQHGLGALFGALDQRHDLAELRSYWLPDAAPARARRRRSSGRARVLRQVVGAFLHFGEGLRRCPPAPATPTWRAAATASATGRWPPPAAAAVSARRIAEPATSSSNSTTPARASSRIRSWRAGAGPRCERPSTRQPATSSALVGRRPAWPATASPCATVSAPARARAPRSRRTCSSRSLIASARSRCCPATEWRRCRRPLASALLPSRT